MVQVRDAAKVTVFLCPELGKKLRGKLLLDRPSDRHAFLVSKIS